MWTFDVYVASCFLEIDHWLYLVCVCVFVYLTVHLIWALHCRRCQAWITHTHTHTHMHTHTNAHTYTHTQMHTHAHTHTHRHTSIYTHIHTHREMHTNTHTHTHTYTNTCTHTHIHIVCQLFFYQIWYQPLYVSTSPIQFHPSLLRCRAHPGTGEWMLRWRQSPAAHSWAVERVLNMAGTGET